MEVRLVALLASSIRVRSEYVLARLDFALAHPEHEAPPLLRRLQDASEATLREEWDGYERELAAIGRYINAYQAGTCSDEGSDATFAWLKRLLRELDQYARAVRWVLTVSERDSA